MKVAFGLLIMLFGVLVVFGVAYIIIELEKEKEKDADSEN
jgi:hypothetical protein